MGWMLDKDTTYWKTTPASKTNGYSKTARPALGPGQAWPHIRNIAEVGRAIQKVYSAWIEGRHLPQENIREHIKQERGLLLMILSDVEPKPLRLHTWMLERVGAQSATFVPHLLLHTGGKVELAISKHVSHLSACQLALRKNDVPAASQHMREESQ